MKFSAIEPLESRIAPATISIASNSILEGNGDKTIYFTVTVTPDNGDTVLSQNVDVTVSTEAGGSDSATAGADYDSASGQLTFLAGGSLTQQFAVTIKGDTAGESAETFTVKLSNAVGADIVDGETTGTILNDDATITIFDVGQSEANSPMKFKVALSHVLGADLSVDYATGGGTATKGVDYTDTVGTLTFAKGESEKYIDVAILDDLLDELGETFNITLSGMKIDGEARAFKSGDDSTAVGTIQNDELVLSIGNWTGQEGTGGAKNAVFTVTMNQASDHDVTFTYSTANGTAKSVAEGTNPADYTGASNISVTIPKGQTTAQILVPIKGDALIESNEDFTVTLNSADHAIIDPAAKTGTATIENDDPTIKISDVTIVEGNGGTKTAVFFVSLAGDPGTGEVTVDYKTINGTATAVEDYTHKEGTLTFTSSSLVQTVSVPIVGDTRRELQEYFDLKLSNAGYKASGASTAQPLTLSDDAGRGTIMDDDLNPTLSVTDSKISEDGTKMIFTVTLSQASDLAVNVDYATQDFPAGLGKATAGDDYTSAVGTLTFAKGETVKTVEVLISDDSVVEADEAFQLKLSNATIDAGAKENLTITRDLATGTILNDDVKLSVSDAEIAEGGGTMKFTISLDQAAAADVVVTYSLADVLAKAGVDYTAPKAGENTVTIKAGDTTATIEVPIIDDNLYEGGSAGTKETFNLTITNATNAEIDDGAAVGKIQDNDAEPKITFTGPKIGANPDRITEGNSTNPTGTYTVELDRPSSTDITFFYKTEELTQVELDGDPTLHKAVSGTDYTANAGTMVTIKAGETKATFTVASIGDALDEYDEQFKVSLYNIVGAEDLAADKKSIVTTIVDDDAGPAITITDAIVNEGAKTMTFTVNASAVAGRDINVFFKTEGMTATGGVDYVERPGTDPSVDFVKIDAGQTSATFTVTINDDADSEVDEKFRVLLTSSDFGRITDAEAFGTIRNDEASFKIVPVGPVADITGNQISISEDPGDGTANQAHFKVYLTGAAPDGNTTVTYKTVDGSATSSGARADFVAKTGTLVFAKGETVKDVFIDIAKDANFETDETFTIVLTDSAGASISVAPVGGDTENIGKVVIKNNDTAPTVSISDAQIVEGDSGTSKMTFTVKLSAANETEDLKVVYKTADGGAVSSGARPDYQFTEGTVTFAKGETEKTFTIDINGDTTDEADQSFFVDLTADAANPSLTFSDAQGKGLIIDNDLPPIISISDLTIGESDTGEPTNVFVIRLTNANGASAESELPITVHYKTINGTAIAGTDFTGVAESDGLTVTFDPNTSQKTITIALLDDDLDEANETFKVQIYDPTNATIGRSTALGTITDDDGSPFVAINDASIIEGDTGFSELVFTVSLSSTSNLPISVDFTTANATPADGIATSSGDFYDYIAQAGKVTFAAGETEKEIRIKIVNDTYIEADEQFEVKLSNAVNATIADASGVGTILNGSDTKYGLVLKDAYIVEGRPTDTNGDGKIDASDTTNKVTFGAVLSAKAPTGGITVKLSTQNGTAIAGTFGVGGADYVARTDQSLFIGSGSSSASFDVNVLPDTGWEATESFFLNLVEAPDSVIVVDNDALGTFKATARGYILNDDVNVISNRQIQWIDVDGDLVTLTVSKGSLNTFINTDLTAGNSYFGLGTQIDDMQLVATKTAAGENLGGYVLQLLDFTNDSGMFAGASVTVTATAQPGFPLAGDGLVNVGWIASAIFLNSEFQVAGWDLGTITIDGDLAMITAGDSFSTPAISKLDVYSLGVNGSLSLPASITDTEARLVPRSDILGPISTVNIKQNLQGFLHVIGAQYGNISTLKIGGALLGTTEDGSGKIEVTGRINSATIGSIIGGTGAGSGLLTTSFNVVASNLGTIKVLGDIVGGAGDNSGKIASPKVGNVTVGGSLIGGTGDQSGVIGSQSTLGAITIGGDIIGGNTDADSASETTSGALVAGGAMGAIKVGGSIIGGGAASSGAILGGTQVAGNIASVSIGGGLIGGAGTSSGSIVANGGSIGAVTIGQTTDGDSILGGSGERSGRLFSALNLASLTTAGDVQGGTGNDSGEVQVDAILTKLLIKGSLVGGIAPGVLTTGGTAAPVENSGFIRAIILKSATIEKDIVSGQNGGAGIVNAGAIRTDVIESLTVGSSLKGNAAVPVIISALGATNNLAIKTVLIKGDVLYSEFLSGYDADATTAAGTTPYNPRGNVQNADASIGSITINGNIGATNIVAGGVVGADGRFGTADDRLASGKIGSTNIDVRDVRSVVSQIASVIIKGNVIANADPYGIIAQHIVSVKYGTPAVTLPLVVGAGNDKAASDTDPSPGKELGAGTNFRAIELLLPV